MEKIRKIEEIKNDRERMQYIKKIIYGYGIPEPEAKEYWKDRKRLQEEYNKAIRLSRSFSQ